MSFEVTLTRKRHSDEKIINLNFYISLSSRISHFTLDEFLTSEVLNWQQFETKHFLYLSTSSQIVCLSLLLNGLADLLPSVTTSEKPYVLHNSSYIILTCFNILFQTCHNIFRYDSNSCSKVAKVAIIVASSLWSSLMEFTFCVGLFVCF